MRNNQLVMQAHSSIGDAAVDGLFEGVVAGIAMALYLAATGKLSGVILSATLSAFDLGQGTSPIRGALIHLALATIYGLVFGLSRRLIMRGNIAKQSHLMIIGLVYGLLLWLMTQITFAGGLDVPVSSLPSVHFAAAHALYGLILGGLNGRAKLVH